MLLICPEYIGERWTLARITSCVAGVVRVIPHSICGVLMRSVIAENGSGGSSPGCISTAAPTMKLATIALASAFVFSTTVAFAGTYHHHHKYHRGYQAYGQYGRSTVGTPAGGWYAP